VTRLIAVAPNPSIDRFFEVDGLALGEVNRPTQEVRVAGGKGLNAARVAAALGANVVVSGVLAGHAGRWIADEMARERVRASWAWIDGETRSCIAIADRASGALTEVNEAGPTISAGEWDVFVAMVAELVREEGGLLSMSGSLPPGAPVHGVAELTALAARSGSRAIVDVAGDPLLPALEARPWLVKLNAREASDALGRLGRDADTRREGLASLLAERADVPTIVTLGSDGAVWASPEGPPALHVTLSVADGRYPVGSGDAFLAGFAVAALAGDPVVDALRLGAGAGAANAMVPGAGRLDPVVARHLATRASISEIS
jgi:1-phosphofructokinase family hexose kinase